MKVLFTVLLLLAPMLGIGVQAGLLKACHEAGYNVVQMQVLNDVPSFNVYGTPSGDRDRGRRAHCH